MNCQLTTSELSHSSGTFAYQGQEEMSLEKHMADDNDCVLSNPFSQKYSKSIPYPCPSQDNRQARAD